MEVLREPNCALVVLVKMAPVCYYLIILLLLSNWHTPIPHFLIVLIAISPSDIREPTPISTWTDHFHTALEPYIEYQDIINAAQRNGQYAWMIQRIRSLLFAVLTALHGRLCSDSKQFLQERTALILFR